MSQNKVGSVEKTHVLVIANVNWADEMDIGGFKVWEVEVWNKFKTDWESHIDTVEFSIGTNEELYYRNGKDYLKRFTTKPITKVEADHLKALFVDNYYTDVTGVIHWPDSDGDYDIDESSLEETSE